MPVSHLTTTEYDLFSSLVAEFPEYPFSPLTQSRAQYLATVASGVTGASHSHLRTTENGLLALIAADLSAGSVSELTSSDEAMMEIIVNNGVPENALALNDEILTLNDMTLTLGE